VTIRSSIHLNLSLYPDTLHDVLKQLDLPDLLYITIQRSVILNTCNIESSYVTAHFISNAHTYLHFCYEMHEVV